MTALTSALWTALFCHYWGLSELPGFLPRLIHVSLHPSLSLFLNPLLSLFCIALLRNLTPLCIINYCIRASSQFLGLSCSPKSQIRVWDCQKLSQVTILHGTKLKVSKTTVVISTPDLPPKSRTSIPRPLWNPKSHPQLYPFLNFCF